MVEIGQIVQTDRNRRVVLSKTLESEGEGLPVQRFGIGVDPFFFIEGRQIIQDQ